MEPCCFYVHYQDNIQQFKDNTPSKFTVALPTAIKTLLASDDKPCEIALIELFARYNGFHKVDDMYLVTCNLCEPTPTPRLGSQRLLRALPMNKSYIALHPTYQHVKDGSHSFMELAICNTVLQPINTLHDLTLLLHVRPIAQEPKESLDADASTSRHSFMMTS